ncbi:MAG: beta-ketoacyl synthase N-terminal-like domain-containing protein [Acidobacteriota bacterium]|nr:beta-ketoacyl synthase N-terminal-like domain-containing protein [Acidobacteriota bacterium]
MARLLRILAGESLAFSETESAAALAEFLPPARTRRLDPLGRMALLAAYTALRDAGLAPEEARSERWGIVVGTAFGPQTSTFSYLDGLIDSGDHLVSSLAFTNSVHNLPAAQVSLALGITGPVQTLSAFGETAGAALQTACGWIRTGRADRVLVILGEESSPVMDYVVGRMGGGAGSVRPLTNECTYAPRPGGAALLLGSGAAGYAGILEVAEGLTTAEAASQAAAADLLYCAASGRSDEAGDYRVLASRSAQVRAHAGFYGSLATGLGLETAIAALALAGRLPEGNPSGSAKPRTAAVAGVAGPNRVTLVSLED